MVFCNNASQQLNVRNYKLKGMRISIGGRPTPFDPAPPFIKIMLILYRSTIFQYHPISLHSLHELVTQDDLTDYSSSALAFTLLACFWTQASNFRFYKHYVLPFIIIVSKLYVFFVSRKVNQVGGTADSSVNSGVICSFSLWLCGFRPGGFLSHTKDKVVS